MTLVGHSHSRESPGVVALWIESDAVATKSPAGAIMQHHQLPAVSLSRCTAELASPSRRASVSRELANITTSSDFTASGFLGHRDYAGQRTGLRAPLTAEEDTVTAVVACLPPSIRLR